MTNLDEQIEELILERNSFEAEVKKYKQDIKLVSSTAINYFADCIIESGQLSGSDNEFIKTFALEVTSEREVK
jgi:hypothetical protein